MNANSITISLPWELRLMMLANRLMRAVAGTVKRPATDMQLREDFMRVIEQESATISKICFSYAGSVAEYEDLRQDALINIWRGMANFRGESQQKTWIYRVTVNSCLSTLRNQRRHSHDSLDGLYSLIAEDDSSDREAIERLHRIIGTLAPQEKAIIMMWLDEMPYEEIGTAMGLNRNTVATRLRRIKDKITDLYKKDQLRNPKK